MTCGQTNMDTKETHIHMGEIFLQGYSSKKKKKSLTLHYSNIEHCKDPIFLMLWLCLSVNESVTSLFFVNHLGGLQSL